MTVRIGPVIKALKKGGSGCFALQINGRKELPLSCKSERAIQSQMQFDSSEICNFCKDRGHWKADCTKASTRGETGGRQVKSVACAVSVEHGPVISHCQSMVSFFNEPDFSACSDLPSLLLKVFWFWFIHLPVTGTPHS